MACSIHLIITKVNQRINIVDFDQILFYKKLSERDFSKQLFNMLSKLHHLKHILDCN